jgi:hypothetical protein
LNLRTFPSRSVGMLSGRWCLWHLLSALSAFAQQHQCAIPDPSIMAGYRKNNALSQRLGIGLPLTATRCKLSTTARLSAVGYCENRELRPWAPGGFFGPRSHDAMFASHIRVRLRANTSQDESGRPVRLGKNVAEHQGHSRLGLASARTRPILSSVVAGIARRPLKKLGHHASASAVADRPIQRRGHPWSRKPRPGRRWRDRRQRPLPLPCAH